MPFYNDLPDSQLVFISVINRTSNKHVYQASPLQNVKYMSEKSVSKQETIKQGRQKDRKSEV